MEGLGHAKVQLCLNAWGREDSVTRVDSQGHHGRKGDLEVGTEKVWQADPKALMFPMSGMGSHENLYFDWTWFCFVYVLNDGVHAMVCKWSQRTIFKNWWSSPSTMLSQGWNDGTQGIRLGKNKISASHCVPLEPLCRSNVAWVPCEKIGSYWLLWWRLGHWW